MKFTHKFWIGAVIVLMIGMFLGFYHAPIKTTDEVRNEIAIELKSTYPTLDSVVVNSIIVSPHEGSLDGEDIQKFTFNTKNDSVETTYNGWIFTDRTFLGYDIKSIKVNK